MPYIVNNVGTYYTEHTYTVIRDCRNDKYSPGYWFYGSYDSCSRASEVAREIGNGIVVTPDEIEVNTFSTGW